MTGAPPPNWRKPVGMLGLLVLMLFWVVMVASFANEIARLHVALQLLLYVVLGIVWIFPVRPLLTWMETGRWKA